MAFSSNARKKFAIYFSLSVALGATVGTLGYFVTTNSGHDNSFGKATSKFMGIVPYRGGYGGGGGMVPYRGGYGGWEDSMYYPGGGYSMYPGGYGYDGYNNYGRPYPDRMFMGYPEPNAYPRGWMYSREGRYMMFDDRGHYGYRGYYGY